MQETIDLKRRYLLAGTAMSAGLLAAGVRTSAQEAATALPDYVSFKVPDAMILHSNNTIETQRGAIGTSLITPESKLYIRNNVTPPSASVVEDRDAWEVEIAGVANPRSMTVGELKTLGIESVAMVLQCSGNGRGLYPEEISGTQWMTGAAGNVIWTGVPLGRVVEALGGVAPGAVYVTGTGGEEIPEGIDPLSVLVERSVPVEELDNILLAWDINGEPISLAHGGPLRMIVPGYTGVNNVKYLKKLAFTTEQSPARIQQTRYRLAPYGTSSTPEHPSVWKMEVKSWITGPLESAGAGPVVITGVAFGGYNAVSGVEVSADGGATWQAAEFVGPDLGRFGWRVFAAMVELAPGEHQLMSRATDSEGNAQPEVTETNNSGYNNNGWRVHGVTVTVA
ncbi:sulfite oxidase [Halovulum dunhuangense]|uniref:Sulfite oxidase n=1 Tax=Halovulum dunhuangense TaxID=1505036 RepID=A0A849L538_9RHOB|nr:sulfite oxidase [Halovulum dunhuangense]NNU81476.1 sulfite oxidase [Halovulum dunhuangense]